MSEKESEFEKLGRMVSEGFFGMEKRFRNLLQEEIGGLRNEMHAGFAMTDKRLSSLEDRFNSFEIKVMDHEKRITHLENPEQLLKRKQKFA